TCNKELIGGGDQRAHQFIFDRSGSGNRRTPGNLVLAQSMGIADRASLSGSDDGCASVMGKFETKHQWIEKVFAKIEPPLLLHPVLKVAIPLPGGLYGISIVRKGNGRDDRIPDHATE